MIPWRDHSFLTDEDDIYFREKLKLKQERQLATAPVPGSQFYEAVVPESRTTETSAILYFDHLHTGGEEDRNHVLLFCLNLGVFTTSLGVLWILKYKLIPVICLLLILFGCTNFLLQTIELLKNEDTHTEEEDMRDQTERVIFLAVGLLMILAALLLHLLHQ